MLLRMQKEVLTVEGNHTLCVGSFNKPIPLNLLCTLHQPSVHQLAVSLQPIKRQAPLFRGNFRVNCFREAVAGAPRLGRGKAWRRISALSVMTLLLGVFVALLHQGYRLTWTCDGATSLPLLHG